MTATDLINLAFQSRGEYCKGGEEAPPPNLYPNDVLACRASLPPAAILPAAILTTAAILLSSTAI